MDKWKDVISDLLKYKVIVFDLDGTLVNLGVDWEDLKKKLSEYCHRRHKAKVVFSPLDNMLLRIRSKFGSKFYSELLEIISQYELKEENYILNHKLINYINSARNQKIAIYSMNTSRCVDNFVKKYLTRKPDVIISKENCIEPKPTDKDLKKILELWKIKKGEMIYVGNLGKDIKCGELAGIRTEIVEI